MTTREQGQDDTTDPQETSKISNATTAEKWAIMPEIAAHLEEYPLDQMHQNPYIMP